MFTFSTLKTGLKGWIGFRDSDDPAIPLIDSDLTASSSGMYWDDFHSLLYPDLLYYVSPNYEANNYSAYSSVATYDTGDKVLSASIPWQSKTDDNSGNTPAVGDDWETLFSVWLGERVNSSIAKLFNKVATDKKLQSSTKSIFSNIQLFTGAGLLSETLTKSSRLVGLSITPKKINNIQVVLNQIGLQFTAAQTNLTIYLWHSSRKAAYKTQVVSTVGTNKFHWVSLTDFVLNYVDFTNDIDAGGTWYIGYFEADINGSAVNKSYDFYSGPCVGCPNTLLDNITKYNLWSKYVNIMPFAVDNGNLDGTNLPDIENMGYSESTNYGINLSLTVRPDFTEMILDNKSLITYPLGLQFANDTIEWILSNPATRINTPHSMSKIDAQKLIYELSGDRATFSRGIKGELADAIEGLAVDLSGISAALPKNKPGGIKIGAI
jgi:hypothetical protein